MNVSTGIEIYVDLLAKGQEYSSIAQYLCFLPRSNRIKQYVSILKDISLVQIFGNRWKKINSVNSDTIISNIVVEMGSKYFNDEMEVILEGVVVFWCYKYSKMETIPSVEVSSFYSPKSVPVYSPATVGRGYSGGKSTRGTHYESFETPQNMIASFRASVWDDMSMSRSGTSFIHPNSRKAPNGPDYDTIVGISKIDWTVYGFIQTSPDGRSRHTLPSNKCSNIDYQGLVELVGREDMTRIASLQWLCADPSYMLTAIHHVHSFIQKLYHESHGEKLVQIQIVLATYILPMIYADDSITALQIMLRDGDMGSDTMGPSVKMDQGLLQMDKSHQVTQSFDVELTASLMWRSYMTSMEVRLAIP